VTITKKNILKILQYNRSHWPSRISFIGRSDRKALNGLDELISDFSQRTEWTTKKVSNRKPEAKE